MRNLFKLFTVILYFHVRTSMKNICRQTSRCYCVGFFGLDNALPSLILCNQLGSQLDGMPVNFKFPLDVSSLSETDFEVLDSLGNIYPYVCFFSSS